MKSKYANLVHDGNVVCLPGIALATMLSIEEDDLARAHAAWRSRATGQKPFVCAGTEHHAPRANPHILALPPASEVANLW